MSNAWPEARNELARDFVGVCALTRRMHHLALLLSPEGTILDLKEPLAEVLGRPAAELKGARIGECWPANGREWVRALIQSVVQERVACRQPR